MVVPLSMDLRTRIFEHHRATGQRSVLCARHFDVGEATVRRLLAQQRSRETLEPKAHTGGLPPKIPDDKLEVIRIMVELNNDLVLSELCDRWFDRTGVRVSPPTMSRTLKRAGLTLKKRRGEQSSESDLTSSSGAGSSVKPSKHGSSKRLSSSTSAA